MAGIDIIIIEHVANIVISTVRHMHGAVPLWEVVAMSIVVVAFFELMGGVLEVMVSTCEVKWRIRVRPEFCPLPGPPHSLKHLVPVNIPTYPHPFHLKVQKSLAAANVVGAYV